MGRETHLQERFRKVAGDCRRWPTNVGAITFVKPRGAYAPRSCSRAFAHRRNCDFCDAHTHTHQERQVSARRVIGKRTCKGASAIAWQTAAGALAHAVAIAFV